MNQENRESYIYDIETLKSCFTLTVLNIDTQKIKQFTLHKNRWEFKELIEFLSICKGMIGFNNISFDYPVIHHIWKNKKNFELLNNDLVINNIYIKAQECIVFSNNKQYNHLISEKEFICPQLDLFRIWHYNNKAKSTSLKALEISMNYPNVMEMSLEHSKENISLEEVEQILEYNLNDVLATYEFYKKSFDKIELRKSLNSQFKLNCLNYSDSKIGESLILKLYSDVTDIDKSIIKDMRSNREQIALNDIILPYIKFKSVEFNELLDFFKHLIIKETKNSIEKSVIYEGFKYDFGLGGIHGCIKPGIYESNEEFIIIDADVSSLYPNLSIQNNLYPEHLGEIFVNVYKSLVDKRIEAKKAKNMTLSDGFKLAANSIYGKSNDEFSFLYDPKFTMSITLAGQLSIAMLCEQLVNTFDLQILQVNTDGITIKFHRRYLEDYYQICKEWEKLTKLTLEYVEYSKMIIGDVNNYIAVTTFGKIKNKGRFEVDKVVGSEPAYHKDNSFRVIPLALQEYFVNNISVEQTIYSYKNIYDFCGRQKFKGDDYGETHELAYDKDNMLGYDKVIRQQKNTRYYISKPGATFIKKYSKGSNEVINKGYQVTIFNKYIQQNIEDYNINYQFYINECYKEINNIIDKQLELF